MVTFIDVAISRLKKAVILIETVRITKDLAFQNEEASPTNLEWLRYYQGK